MRPEFTLCGGEHDRRKIDLPKDFYTLWNCVVIVKFSGDNKFAEYSYYAASALPGILLYINVDALLSNEDQTRFKEGAYLAFDTCLK